MFKNNKKAREGSTKQYICKTLIILILKKETMKQHFLDFGIINISDIIQLFKISPYIICLLFIYVIYFFIFFKKSRSPQQVYDSEFTKYLFFTFFTSKFAIIFLLANFYPLELLMNIAIQKNKIHRYFQSIKALPFTSLSLTLKQIDQKILSETSNLYSFYDFVNFISSLLFYSDHPFQIWNRLMMLISILCKKHDLYYSKLTALQRIWWESNLFIKKNCENLIKNEKEQRGETLRKSIWINYFYYQTIRCMNCLIQKNPQFKNKSIKFCELSKARLIKIVHVIRKRLSKILQNHESESQNKIYFSFAFCNLVINIVSLLKFDENNLSLTSVNDAEHITQFYSHFCNILIWSVRLMKKFYSIKMNGQWQMLKEIVKKGVLAFEGVVSRKRIKILESLQSILDPKQKQSKTERQKYQQQEYKKKQSNINDKKIKAVWILLNLWRTAQGLKKRKSSMQDSQLILNNKSKKQMIAQRASSRSNEKRKKFLVRSHENKCKDQNWYQGNQRRSRSKTILQKNENITILKRKKSQSLKIQRPKFHFEFKGSIKYEIEKEAQKQTYANNYAIYRYRSSSTSSVDQSIQAIKVRNNNIRGIQMMHEGKRNLPLKIVTRNH